MRYLRQLLLILSMMLFGLGAANAVSVTIGKGDFYVSVGDYDYLPYGGYDRLPRISFYDMMNDYGTWVNVAPFGRAWRPYVYGNWRPFTQGRWIYTRFGLTWEGYEPWAWAAYHYGNWIWSQYYGWVWLPGYEWHPGRVVWSYSYNTIGWMPAPPAGYNYFCGYLCHDRYTYSSGYGYNDPYRRSDSYGYNDPYRRSDSYYPYEEYNDYNDYSEYEDYSQYDGSGYNSGSGYNNDRYQDNRYPGYSDPYAGYGFRYDPYIFTPAYLRIAPQLWVFVPVNYFTNDDYSDVYFESGYTRYLFDRRLVQINPSGLDRNSLERIVQRRIPEEPVEERSMQTEKGTVRVVVPTQERQNIRTHANRVVKEVIAPAFVEKKKTFKAEKSRNNEVVARVFQQDPRRVQTETVNEQTILQEAKKSEETRRVQHQEISKRAVETVEKADREGKLENMKRAREKVEKAQKPEQPNSSPDQSDVPQPRHENPSEQKPEVQKQTQTDRDNGNEAARNEPDKFQHWKNRELTKFNQWKDRQMKDFESWKESHKDQPDEIKKADADFQTRMRRAEEQFQQKMKRAEDQNLNKRPR